MGSSLFLLYSCRFAVIKINFYIPQRICRRWDWKLQGGRVEAEVAGKGRGQAYLRSDQNMQEAEHSSVPHGKYPLLGSQDPLRRQLWAPWPPSSAQPPHCS